ncbi:hypothetical protein OIV83_003564 [Microbotryomycetes sp. JL201]|nr:hypothetical protein OIV83_003564 [Microbotryomycetes sp. JL201]
MFGKPTNPYEEVVAKATDEKQTEVSWDILLTVWDKVNEDGEAGARNCVAALQKRLQHRSANVQLFSLTLAGALVNNCGPPLHREISGRAFTQTLARLINDRTTHESVKKEAMKCIEDWVKEHPGNSDFDLMAETYESLKRQNHRFSSDRPKTPPPNPRSEELMRREEEELQRALAESAAMADPRKGFVPSQPPASSDKDLPQQPNGHSPAGREPPKAVRAVYDFAGQGPDELGFARGDIIKVIDFADANWWRGELRGRTGIFPANRVEELPEQPAAVASLKASSSEDMEAEIFAKAASIDKLLAMMRNLSARGEDLADNEELADRYNECMALAPKIVALIRKYDQKQIDLREMHDKFARAKSVYERMTGYGGPARGPQPAYGPPQGYANAVPYGQQPAQLGYPAPYQTLTPHDPERERREYEEQQRREYEAKYAQYQRDLAEYEAAQARLAAQQQQQAPLAQAAPVAHQPYPTPQQPPASHSQAQPAQMQPVWDGRQWIHPAQSAAPAAVPLGGPAAQSGPGPHQQAMSPHMTGGAVPMTSPSLQRAVSPPHVTPVAGPPHTVAPSQYPSQPYPDMQNLTRSVSQLSVGSTQAGPGQAAAAASSAAPVVGSLPQPAPGVYVVPSQGPQVAVPAPETAYVAPAQQGPAAEQQQSQVDGLAGGQQQGYVYASEEEREAAAKAWEEYYEKKRVYDEWVASQGGAAAAGAPVQGQHVAG